jgi:branched-chain amino acid transport system substrate-binding protein
MAKASSRKVTASKRQHRIRTISLTAAILAAGLIGQSASSFAARYDSGASDTEIKIGNTMAYSGPASSYGTIGRVEAAYFQMVNGQGGINGRKIIFLSEDDAYSPPRTVEKVRKLVEQDEVLLMFNTLGTAPSVAVEKYLNAKKIPQLFVASGATRWGNYQEFPWSMGLLPSYRGESRIYAKYIMANLKSPKIAVLYQNDDYGKDFLEGFKDELGPQANLIVAEQSYEASDPTIQSQVAQLKSSGATVLFIAATAKAAAQAIRIADDLGWKPVRFVNGLATSMAGVIIPAGIDRAQGLLSSFYLKDADDPAWANDPGLNAWRSFMQKYYPQGSLHDGSNIFGYTAAQALVQVLRQCGDTLTRENVMRQAANLKNVELDLLLPGIKLNTSPTDYFPVEQAQMQRFVGTRWERFGPIVSDN